MRQEPPTHRWEWKVSIFGLENGDYSITIDTTTLPEGYKITLQNQGADDSLDSDIDPESGKSDSVTIADSNNTH